MFSEETIINKITINGVSAYKKCQGIRITKSGRLAFYGLKDKTKYLEKTIDIFLA